MEKLARQQTGFLGIESVEDTEGFEMTVSYWAKEGDVRNWKINLKHQAAQRQGRILWYEHYEIRVAYVERAYNTMTSNFDS